MYTITYAGVEIDMESRNITIVVIGNDISDRFYIFTQLEEFTQYQFTIVPFTTIGQGVSVTVGARTFQDG